MFSWFMAFVMISSAPPIAWGSGCGPKLTGGDQPSSAPRFTFNQIGFHFAFKDQALFSRIEEYLPAGETLEHWTRMFSMTEYIGLFEGDSKDIARQFIGQLKKNNSQIGQKLKIEVIPGNEPDSSIVDFITYDLEKRIIEFDLYRVRRSKRGIFFYQYAERSYGTHVKRVRDETQHRKAELSEELNNFNLYFLP